MFIFVTVFLFLILAVLNFHAFYTRNAIEQLPGGGLVYDRKENHNTSLNYSREEYPEEDKTFSQQDRLLSEHLNSAANDNLP